MKLREIFLKGFKSVDGAEGQTEQSFAKKVLGPHLAERGVYVDARCVLTSRDRRAAKGRRGGLASYDKVATATPDAEKIDITALRARRRHFGEWVSGLEQLSEGAR